MKVEHVLYAASSCAAAISAVWAVQLYMSGPQQLEGLAFNEYATIDDPLYRQPDKLHIEPQGFGDELITGSIPKLGNPTKAKRTHVTGGYDIVSVYDKMAVVKNRSGKIWTLVPGSELPEVGVILKIEATDKHWIVTGTHGIVATTRFTEDK